MLRKQPHESKGVNGQTQRPKPYATKTRHMVDESRLGTHQGELGPICDFCGARLTFGQSIPIDSKYACFECYQNETGATPSSEPKAVEGLPID